MYSGKPPRGNRYFGMTAPQITIITVLAVMNCILLVLGGKLILERSASTNPSAPPPQVTPSTTSVPAATPQIIPTLEPDWILYDHRTEGFSIALPSAWAVADLEAATLEAAFSQIREYYPGFSNAQMEQMTMDEVRATGLKLLAVDTSLANSEATYVGQVNVGCQFIAEFHSLDESVRNIVEGYQAQGIKPIAHQRVILPAGEAEKLQYRVNNNGRLIDNTQYLLIKGQITCFVTMSSASDSIDRYTPAFEKIIKTFRWAE